jgi:hypothetical protein
MDQLFDELTKSLSQAVPRRESLRRLGAVFAGAVLSPLGIETAWAARQDPCKAFCKCRNAQQQNKCLAACNACNKDTSRLCGACGTYVCCALPGPNEFGACISGTCQYSCSEGSVRCSGTCTEVETDPDNCGACGNVCPVWAPYCSDGICFDTNCGGADLNWDSSNCGTCGNVCPWGTACVWGFCEGGGGF